MITTAHCNRCDASNAIDPDDCWACRLCGHEHEPQEEQFIVVKGGTRLSAAEAKTALEEAMKIIEAVGTTGIHHRHEQAQAWMKRYFPNWA